MSGVIARALAMVALVFQDYFDSETGNRHDSTIPSSNFASARDDHSVIHLAGLVLARGGSKGIPKKNLVEINGRPLVGIALDAMIESGVFKSIWVSTDDKDIFNWVTSQYSPKTVAVHHRAAYTATDSASSIIAVLEFLNVHPEILLTEVDAVGLVQATSPFVQAQYLKMAGTMLLRQDYESVFSVTRSHQLRWTVIDKKEKWTKPINFFPKSRPRRQDWKGEMVENGMFYFAHRHVLTKGRVFQTDKSGYVEIPKELSMEIDTNHDLLIARCVSSNVKRQNGKELGEEIFSSNIHPRDHRDL